MRELRKWVKPGKMSVGEMVKEGRLLTGIVVDTSIALAWFVWSLKIANACGQRSPSRAQIQPVAVRRRCTRMRL